MKNNKDGQLNSDSSSLSVVLPSKGDLSTFSGERFVPGLGDEIELEHLHRYLYALNLVKGQDVLDIACGEGYGSFILSQHAKSVVGVDIAEAAVERARQNYKLDGLSFQVGDCEKIPLADNSVDWVVSFETIEHITGQERFLSEVRRVLRPHGSILISSPDKEVYNQNRDHPNEYHVKELSVEEFEGLLKQHFKFVSLVGQRNSFNSIISTNATAEIQYLCREQTSVVAKESLSSSVYLLAVCSNEKPCDLNNSLFEGDVTPYLVSALKGGCAERDKTIVALLKELDEIKRGVASFEKKEVAKDNEVEASSNLNGRVGELQISLQAKSAEISQLALSNKENKEEAALCHRIALDKFRDCNRQFETIQQLRGENNFLSNELSDARTLYSHAKNVCEYTSKSRSQMQSQMLEWVRNLKIENALPLLSKPSFIFSALSLGKILSLKYFVVLLLNALSGGKCCAAQRIGWKKFRELTLIKRSGLFDGEFYLNEYLDVARSGMDPLLHYCLYGAAEHRRPTVWFDSRYYLEKYGDVAKAKVDPFVHYILRGRFESRKTSAVFGSVACAANATWLSRYAFSKTEKLTSLTLSQRQAFEKLFDAEYYSQQSGYVSSLRSELMAHFLEVGAFCRWNPHPLFDCAHYLAACPDLCERGFNPLVHYLTCGAKEGKSPHPLFDTDFYRRQFDKGFENIEFPLIHYLEEGWRTGKQPSFFFDGDYYLAKYGDVKAAGVNPLEHYLRSGWKEQRSSTPFFDSKFYSKKYIDVAASGADPLMHFACYGFNEGRDSLSSFDREFFSQWRKLVGECDGASFRDYVEHCFVRMKQPLSDADMRGLVDSINAISQQVEVLCGEESAQAPEVSIVIPVYNQLRYTLQCVQSLMRVGAKRTFEILVVDDRSTDKTAAAISGLQKVRYVGRAENGGFIAACNQGAAAARGKYLVFLNNDTVVMPGWLDALYESFQSQPKVGLVGSQLLYPDGSLQEAGCLVWQDGSAWNYGRNADRQRAEFNYMRSVDYCSGASIMLPKDLFDSLAGFDVCYSPAYCEDSDLAFKIRAKGYQVLYQPYSKVVHFEGVSSGTDISKGVKAYQVTNAAKFFDRWRETLAAHRPNGKESQLERDRGYRGRVLFVDACTPTPDRDAGSVTADNWIRILQKLGLKVTFMPQDNLAYIEGYTDRLQRRGVECAYRPAYESIESFFENNRDVFSHVIVFRYGVAKSIYPHLERYSKGSRTIFHPMDLHFLRTQRKAELENSSALLFAAKKEEIEEMAVVAESDLVCTHSTHEMEIINKKSPATEVTISPLIFDIPGCNAPFEKRKDICFIGGYNHSPNVDAVQFFAREVMPILARQEPNIRFLVVGSQVPREFKELENKNVVIRGFVEDIAEILNSVRLCIAPLRYGAGVKGKVGISLSYGVPVVGTTCAVEGMGLTNGQDVLVANTPEEFVSQIKRAYFDRNLWSKLSEAGLKVAFNQYSLEANTPLLEEYLWPKQKA